MGNFKISDTVFKQIVDVVAEKTQSIYRVHRTIIKKHEGVDDGIYIYIEVILEFGYNVSEAIQKLKSALVKDIEYLTSMNVLSTEIVAKGVHVNKE